MKKVDHPDCGLLNFVLNLKPEIVKHISTTLIALAALSFASNAQQNTWTQIHRLKGPGRFGAVGFSIGNYGYIGTGSYNLKDFWRYNPANDTWTQKADFGGTSRFYAVGFSIDNRGYIGTGNGAGFYKKDFWEYNPNTNTWTQKGDFGGAGKIGATGFSIGNKGYVGTGYDSSQSHFTKDFWEYDPAIDSWTQKADFGGIARMQAVSFSIGSMGYIGTGYGNLTGTNDFWEYDPATNSWTQKANFGGKTRSEAVGFSIGNKGYIGTGYGSGNINLDANDFWEYDPAINAWTERADFGGPERWNAVGFSIGNKGYIGTGDCCAKRDFWEYTQDTSSCPIPSNLSTTDITSSWAHLRWGVVAIAKRYVVRYRVTNADAWIIKTSKNNHMALQSLSPVTQYECEVKTVCQVEPEITSDWSSSFFFTTYLLKEAASEIISAFEFSIFPNPNNGTFELQGQTSIEQSLSIKVFDVSGKEVFSSEEEIVSGTFKKQIDLNNLASGMYTVRVIHDNTIETKRILVE